MAQTLKPEQFTRIIELVAPHMSSENRRTYITPWCMGHSKLYDRIDWDGPERSFATHVIELFLNHGELEPNCSALQAFLEAVREDMGRGDRAEMDGILAEIARETEFFRKTQFLTQPLTLSPHNPDEPPTSLVRKRSWLTSAEY